MSDLIHGDVADGFGTVADAFRRNFAERRELGAAVAVVHDGEIVVDLWGGHRDRKRTAPWERDTLVTVWSTTKGMAATAMAVAHSRGLFDLEAPVATYWPEFAQAGKETVTVRQLLEHEAGLQQREGERPPRTGLELGDVAHQRHLLVLRVPERDEPARLGPGKAADRAHRRRSLSGLHPELSVLAAPQIEGRTAAFLPCVTCFGHVVSPRYGLGLRGASSCRWSS